MHKLLLLLFSGIWLGLVIGLSFIEAPLKFTAPGITTELGLGIGRIVFGVLNKIEITMTLLFAIIAYNKRKEMVAVLKGAIVLLIAIVVFQSLYLLPVLDERAVRLLAGEELEMSMHHIMYIIVEVVKLPALLTVFIKTYRIEVT